MNLYWNNSIGKDHWSSFKYFSNPLFEEEFVEHHVSWRVLSKSRNGSAIRIKQDIDVKSGKMDSRDEVRVMLPWENRSIIGEVTSGGCRLIVDNGLVARGNHWGNLYGAVSFFKNFSQYSVKVGAKYITSNTQVDTRLKINKDKELSLGCKVMHTIKEWRTGLLGVLDTSGVVKKDVVLGYVKDEYQGYFTAEQQWTTPTKDWSDITQWFSRCTAKGMYTRNERQKYGLQVKYDTKARQVENVELLVQYTQNENNGLKAKIDKNYILSFVLKRRFIEQLMVSLGVTIPLAASKDANSSKVGIRAQWNV